MLCFSIQGVAPNLESQALRTDGLASCSDHARITNRPSIVTIKFSPVSGVRSVDRIPLRFATPGWFPHCKCDCKSKCCWWMLSLEFHCVLREEISQACFVLQVFNTWVLVLEGSLVQNAFLRDSGRMKCCGGSEPGKSSSAERRFPDGLASCSDHARIILEASLHCN